MGATRQHYLPASYLGRFSWTRSGRLRRRPLWVRHVRSANEFVATAEKMASEFGLYDLRAAVRPDSDDTIDRAWGYEARLPQALDALTNRDELLDAGVWTSTLVPFVAGLFARDADFKGHFDNRLPQEVLELLGPDNSTYARLIDFQRLLAPIMAAHWSVLHFSGHNALVTSDRGYTVASTPLGLGYAIPIDPQTALAVTLCPGRPILSWTHGRWAARVAHFDVADSDIPGFRRAIGAFARHAVCGPTKAAVGEAARELGDAPPVLGGLLLGQDLDLGCHLYDYFRVLSALAAAPGDAQAAVDSIDWSAVDARSWTGPIAFEVLFPGRTAGGVSVEGDDIVIDLSFGAAFRKQRRARGDFREGAIFFMDLPNILEREAKIAEIIPPSAWTTSGAASSQGPVDKILVLVHDDPGTPEGREAILDQVRRQFQQLPPEGSR